MQVAAVDSEVWKMWQRIKTAVLLALVMIAVILCGKVFPGYMIYDVAVAFVASAGIYEMLRNTGFVKSKFITVASMVYAVYLVLSFGQYQSLISPHREMSAAIFVLVVFVYSMIDRRHSSAMEPFIAFGATMVIGCAFGTMLALLLSENETGIYYFCLCLAFSWISDIGAYFVGSVIGKHKLCPDISPKKTVEGAIGGVLFCALISIAFGLIFNLLSANYEVNLLSVALCAVPLSIVGIIGDLLFSYIKRYCEIKDYGTLLPGHGGILDRFDSVLTVAPVMYALTKLITFIA